MTYLSEHLSAGFMQPGPESHLRYAKRCWFALSIGTIWVYTGGQVKHGKSCRYPGYERKEIALHCKNPINWEMAQEICEMFRSLFKCGYVSVLDCSVLTPLFFVLKKWLGINKWGKIVASTFCFVLYK